MSFSGGSGEAASAFKIIQVIANMSLESIPRSQISGSKVNAVIILLDVAKLPSTGVVPFCISVSHVCSARFPIVSPTDIYVFASLIGEKQFPTVVSFELSQILSKVEHLFIWSKGIIYFFL